MNKHCSGCIFHHNAGCPEKDKRSKQFNDWCCLYGKPANKSIGQCKLNNGKKS